MTVTTEEQKKRQDILEREKLAIFQINDTSDLQERVRKEKAKNNLDIVRDSEDDRKKIANPAPDKAL